VEEVGIDDLYELTLKRGELIYKGLIGITNVEYEIIASRAKEILNEEEIEYFNSLSSGLTKETYLRSRFICKTVVCDYSGVKELRSIRIRHGVFNQPLLDGSNRISVSHSGNFVACIVFPDEHPMGLDLEILKSNAVERISSQLTGLEKKLIGNLSEEKDISYTRFWTVKEALSKILMTGLLVPFHLLEINSIKLGLKYDVSYFENFIQYKAVSWNIQNIIVSIVMPAETIFNIEKINLTNKFI